MGVGACGLGHAPGTLLHPAPLFSLCQASRQRLTDQWQRRQWRQPEDQVGRCTGQAAPRHAQCAGEGKGPVGSVRLRLSTTLTTARRVGAGRCGPGPAAQGSPSGAQSWDCKPKVAGDALTEKKGNALRFDFARPLHLTAGLQGTKDCVPLCFCWFTRPPASRLGPGRRSSRLRSWSSPPSQPRPAALGRWAC